jgi:hypothetical protein
MKERHFPKGRHSMKNIQMTVEGNIAVPEREEKGGAERLSEEVTVSEVVALIPISAFHAASRLARGCGLPGRLD